VSLAVLPFEFLQALHELLPKTLRAEVPPTPQSGLQGALFPFRQFRQARYPIPLPCHPLEVIQIAPTLGRGVARKFLVRHPPRHLHPAASLARGHHVVRQARPAIPLQSVLQLREAGAKRVEMHVIDQGSQILALLYENRLIAASKDVPP
jgi:hypothetical protein